MKAKAFSKSLKEKAKAFLKSFLESLQGESQGRNPTLTGLHVPYSLDSGR